MPRDCGVLQGAQGAEIRVQSGIVFTHESNVRILGPLHVTQAHNVNRLALSAISAKCPIHLHADSGDRLVLTNIQSAASGGGVSSSDRIYLEGEGAIVFEGLHSTNLYGGALYTKRSINVTAANVIFRSCSVAGGGGGAACSERNVTFSSPGSALFENCSAVAGGALRAWEAVHLRGGAEYRFQNCSSKSRGGAINTPLFTSNLTDRGSVIFKACGSAQGGAVYTHAAMLSTGRYSFNECESSNGTGIITALAGDIFMAEDADRTIENMSAKHVFYASTITAPVGGSLLAESSYATQHYLASKGPGQSETTCPAGSRFMLTPSGYYSKCEMCPEGYTSLAPAVVNESGKVSKLEDGMKLVWVRKGSPNQVRFDTTAASGVFGGSMVRDWQPLMLSSAMKLGNVSVVRQARKDWSSGTFVEKYWYSRECGTTNGSYKNILPLGFKSDGQAIRVGWQDEKLVTEDGWALTAGWGEVSPGLPVLLTKLEKFGKFWPAKFFLFTVDVIEGTISSQLNPDITLGLGHDVSLQFEPQQPDTCRPCKELAGNAYGKVYCESGTSLRLQPGCMSMPHKCGQRSLSLYDCHNAKACPGGKLRLWANGSTLISENICAPGYSTQSKGCSNCTNDHARWDLDPLKCSTCSRDLIMYCRAVVGSLASAIVYAVALSSAKKPRKFSQQLMKILLSFWTTSGRCAALVNDSQFVTDFLEGGASLGGTSFVFVEGTVSLLSVMQLLGLLEPGGDALAADCLFGRPLTVAEYLAWKCSIPCLLLAVACSYETWKNKKSGALTAAVTWVNVFMPALVGAAARFVPCIQIGTAEGAGPDIMMMYELHAGTPCSSWVGIFFLLGILLVGPLFWTSLTMHPELYGIGKDSDVHHFLTTAYRDGTRCWESVVLMRKLAVVALAVLCPSSCGLRVYLVLLSFVLLMALCTQITCMPYKDSYLNTLEATVLVVALACLVATTAILIPWPHARIQGLIFGACMSVLLMVLVFGTELFLVLSYIRHEVIASWLEQGNGADDGHCSPDQDDQHHALCVGSSAGQPG